MPGAFLCGFTGAVPGHLATWPAAAAQSRPGLPGSAFLALGEIHPLQQSDSSSLSGGERAGEGKAFAPPPASPLRVFCFQLSGPAGEQVRACPRGSGGQNTPLAALGGVFAQPLYCQSIGIYERSSGVDFAGVAQWRGRGWGPVPPSSEQRPGRTWQARVPCCLSPRGLFPTETCGMDLSLVTRVAVGSGRPLSCSVGTAALSCVSRPPYRMGRSIRPGREGLHSVADWPRGLLWPGCHRAKPHFLGGERIVAVLAGCVESREGDVRWRSALLVHAWGGPWVRGREGSATAICHMFRRWLPAPGGHLAFLAWRSCRLA